MALHEHHVNKEKSLIESGNLGRFYKYVNRKLSTKTGIGVLKSDAGDLITDPANQAEMLNAFFATTFVTDNGTLPDFPARVPPDMSLSYIAFPADDVARKLNKLRVDSASGPDGLPTCFLKKMSKFISQPLSKLFDTFFLNSYVPPIWREAYVKPIYKSGNSNDVKNYRPISLTCVSCEIMESIINEQMMYYLLQNDLTLIGTRFSPHVKNQGGVKKHPRGNFAISRESDVRFRWNFRSV